MIDAPTIEMAPAAFRFSGHESFACRYAWLPKAYRAISRNPSIFFDEEEAMVEMGIGKNMVRSLRFWIDAMDVARADANKMHVLTEFAHQVLGPDGFDPFLEDERTLWLLHWHISSKNPGLFAWRHMLGEWPYPEFTRSEALDAFKRQSAKLGFKHSEVTLSQHLDVFIHTYYAARKGKVAIEDSLDGPLVGLGLLVLSGEKRGPSGRWENVFSFRREPKPDITPQLFEYCVMDFWNRHAPQDRTLSLRVLATMPSSPGQVFKLTEDDVRQRLEETAISNANAAFRYQPSAVQAMISRQGVSPTLASIYSESPKHV